MTTDESHDRTGRPDRRQAGARNAARPARRRLQRAHAVRPGRGGRPGGRDAQPDHGQRRGPGRRQRHRVAAHAVAIAGAGAAPDQPGTGGQGPPAVGAECRGGAGQAGTGRKGYPAGAVVAVQVGVPGQYVARAAHAAQLPPDPGAAAGRQPGRQPLRQTGGICPHHPWLRLRPAHADQRHPRPVQDRIGHRHAGVLGIPFRTPAPLRRADLPPHGRSQAPGLFDRAGRRPARQPGYRHHAPAAGREKPAIERLQVYSAWARGAHHRPGRRRLFQRPPRPVPRRRGAGVRRHRHRRGDRGRQAATDLRGVPAGRRLHRPQVRRHRPGAVDLARTGAPARRRDPGAIGAGRGVHLYPLSALAPRRLRRCGNGAGAESGGQLSGSPARGIAVSAARAGSRRHRLPRRPRAAGAWRSLDIDHRRRRAPGHDVAGPGTRPSFQRRSDGQRRLGPEPGARLPALGHPARPRPARYRRSHRAGAPETRSRNPPHSGTRAVEPARTGAGPPAGAAPGRPVVRVLVPRSLPVPAGGPRGAARPVCAHPPLCRRWQAQPAARGARRGRQRRHGGAAHGRRPRDRGGGQRHGRARGLA